VAGGSEAGGRVVTERLVWIARPRKGSSYHHLVQGELDTPCGRYHGPLTEGVPLRGEAINREEAGDLGMLPCRRCYGLVAVVAPTVVRSRDRRPV